MSTSTVSSQVEILANSQKMDKGLRQLERLAKFTLVVFRSNADTPKISTPFLVTATVLCLLSKF
jgi:hypothetical protein